MSEWEDMFDEKEVCPIKGCGGLLCKQTVLPGLDYPDSWGLRYEPHEVKVCRKCGQQVGENY